jgi:hypothetical protein
VKTKGKWPPFLVELVDSCPAAGDGVNFWLYCVARQLHAHLAEQDIFALLKAKTHGCGRTVLDKEIWHQIKAAWQKAWRPNKPEAFPNAPSLPDQIDLAPPRPAWPEPDSEAIRAIVAGGDGLYDFWEHSPVRFEDEDSHADEIIDALFPGNPLLCIGLTSYRFATRRREYWRGHLHRMALMVPNPMLNWVGHPADEDRFSQHTKEATARRVYLGIEFDFSEFARDGKTPSQWAELVREWATQGISVEDACATLHLHLSRLLPLVAVCHSGGKSLHGLYYVFGQNEDHLRISFMEHAVRLGADKATWGRSQFVRIPDGLRKNGQRQRAYYFDPRKAVRI